MRRTLTLCALSSLLLVALGCGDDDGGGTVARDGGANGDAGSSDAGSLDAAVAKGVQVDNVGAPCGTAGNTCQGANATCLQSLGEGSLRFDLPQGYCTAPCEKHEECGAGGGCPLGEIANDPMLSFDITSIVQVPSVCLDRCTVYQANTCRDGYVCRSLRELVPKDILNSPIGLLLISRNFTDTFCMPPVDIMIPGRDAGIADGGLARIVTVVDGMDAGL